MERNLLDSPIGVFDSGVGGISVLADLINQLPNEQYVYYGDSYNAPYGVKSRDEVRLLSLNVVDHLLEYKIKALVVACNTATSAAIEDLRASLDLPVIGMEPALKTGVDMNRSGKIAVMATNVTLEEEKFNRLVKKIADKTRLIKIPCPGLVEIIEKEGRHSSKIEDYIKDIFSPYNLDEVGVVVLGCTHYIFIKDTISRLVGQAIDIVDGNLGTARHVNHLLQASGKLNPANRGQACRSEKEAMLDDSIVNISCRGQFCSSTLVKLINSSHDPDMILLSKRLLEERLKDLNWCGTIKYI